MISNNEIIAEFIEMLGDGRCKLKCSDKIDRIGLLKDRLDDI